MIPIISHPSKINSNQMVISGDQYNQQVTKQPKGLSQGLELNASIVHLLLLRGHAINHIKDRLKVGITIINRLVTAFFT